MKIVIIGATGTIGRAVVQELEARHEIVGVSKKHGQFQLDIKEESSIKQCLDKIGTFDALISCVGNVHFGSFENMTPALYQVGLQDKLMGQVNLVLIGRDYMTDKGSFTLTSGILSFDPIRFGSSASMVNGALESFVRAAAIEMPKGIRLNVVSPTILTESLPTYGAYFRGYPPVTASQVALAYSKSVEGLQTGQVYKVGC